MATDHFVHRRQLLVKAESLEVGHDVETHVLQALEAPDFRQAFLQALVEQGNLALERLDRLVKGTDIDQKGLEREVHVGGHP